MRTPTLLALALIALLPAPARVAAAADADEAPWTVSVRSGLPRIGSAEGRTVTWRTLSIRAESEWLDVDARVPTCLPSPAAPLPRFTYGGGPCDEPVAQAQFAQLGHQYGATSKLPALPATGTLVDLGLRASTGPRAGVNEFRAGAGSTFDVTVTQPVDRFEFYAGHAEPTAALGPRSLWRASYAGVVWRPARGISFEFAADRARATDSGALDRQFTLRASARDGNARWLAFVTRADGSQPSSWNAGFGLEIEY